MPLEFPKDCPPPEAAPLPGEYYRLAPRGSAADTVAPASTWLRPYETRSGEFYKRPESPEAHGLSVFKDLTDVTHASDIAPWMRGKSVARFSIGPTDGDLISSPTHELPSHHDWWTNPYDFAPEGVIVAANLGVVTP